jgi:hypothetical protein
MRRTPLINRMKELESQGSSCAGCAGNCCTYEANSMMATPLEAREILNHIEKTEELKKKIQDTVTRFRLDQSSGNGRRSFIRRTYTCPFFNHQELGCPLPREIKPLGCLAFNSHHPTEKAGQHCYSEKEFLSYEEEKTYLPIALLDLWDN